LVSLGEAVAALRVVSIEQQGVRAHQEALLVDPTAVLHAIEAKAGLDLAFPQVGAACGFRFGNRLVTLDSLWHSYTLYRLRRLGAAPESSIVEIGGGYGCLASFAYKAGHRNYVIVDLPWVNAIQGYFLIMALPRGAVRLYGETTGDIAVLPHWHMRSIPDGSVDYVVNTDSLPEMGVETARHYVRQIARVLRGAFLSINQEGRAPNADVGPQNWVAELIEQHGGFRVVSRHRGWMRQGYVEEVFVLSQRRPAGAASP
jgi:SAM-dependent methyltransferase